MMQEIQQKIPLVFRNSQKSFADLEKLEIETERLILRPVIPAYAPDIFKEFTPEVTKYMIPASPKCIEETQAFIKETMALRVKGQELVMAIFDKKDNSFMGQVGFHPQPIAGVAELGLWTKQSAHGHHYGREAMTALVSWVIENVRLKYLIYEADKANIPSLKIAEALGGKLVKSCSVPTMHDTVLDAVQYQIEVGTW